MWVRGCLSESGLSFNQDRTHSVSVEIIGDWIIFVYMNPDWVATHFGSSSFHFSFRTEYSIRNEMSFRNHVNLDQNFEILDETRNEINVHYARNNIFTYISFIYVYKCIKTKIAGKIRLSVHESQTSFNPEWNLFAVIFQSSTQSPM